MVRATVFLLFALVSSVMLTQTMATENESAVDEGLITSEDVPACQADYAKMDPKQPKQLINYPGLTSSAGVCTNPKNGDFVVGYWQPRAFVYLHDSCGWIKKRIELPRGTSYSVGCVFSGSKLFYAATRSLKLLQYNEEGTYEKVFATGFKFLRLTTRGTRLYSSIESSRMVRVYNTTNGNNVNHFETTTGNTRGLAFDPQGYLHVAIWGKNIEIFTFDGHKVQQVTYPQVSIADGILVDGGTYTIIADRGRRQVLVFNYNNLLVNKIVGFHIPVDVAMGHGCAYLLVSDLGRGTYLL